MSQADQPRDSSSRLTRVLFAVSVILAAAVVVLAILLGRQDAGPQAVASKPTPAPLQPAPDTAPRPYVNLDDPKAPPSVPPAPVQPQPGPDPLSHLLRGFDTLLDDPSLKKALDDLGKTLQQGAGSVGRLFRNLLPAPGAPQKPGAQPDPFDLFRQMLPHSPGFPGAGSERIQADVADEGSAYVVRCRFPKGAPETASFRIRGDTLVVKARFADGDQEKDVALPGPVHPLSARSELVRGQLVVTLPKAAVP